MAQTRELEFLVTLPDHDNVLQTRIENRPKHLAHNAPHFKNGVITFGGPMYASPAATLEEGMSKINGSVHLVRAKSEEEVWQLIRDDPYARLEVWNLNKAKVIPMKSFVMQPMTV